MGNFKKVDLIGNSRGRVSLLCNELSVVVTGTKTPNYILMNNFVSKEVVDRKYCKLNVYCDEDAKKVAFQFCNAGDLTVRMEGDKKCVTSWRLTNKALVGYIMKFFDILPGDTGHHKLIISENKAQDKADCVMYYIRKSGLEQINFK